VAGIIFLFTCQEKKPPELSAPPPSQTELEQRLQELELKWKILQKDHPPEVETADFQFNLAQAKKSLAENNLAQAEEYLKKAKSWIKENQSRYYLIHRQKIQLGTASEDPAKLWKEAEEFWEKEKQAFLQGDIESAGLYSQAGFEQAELAVICAQKSNLPAEGKVNYLLEYAEALSQKGKLEKAQQIREDAGRIIQKQIGLLSEQINWCLSGTIPICDLKKVRENRENFQKAKSLLLESWKEIEKLVEMGNQIFPGKFFPPSSKPLIDQWIEEQEKYLQGKSGGN